MPRVTVAIAAHDAERFLGETLASVHGQTFRDLEIVVADDGSTDATARVAEENGATVVRRRQGGPAAARNDAIARGSGELIAILDADDLWLPDKLKRQVEVLEAKPEAILVTTRAESFGGPPMPAERLHEGRVTEALIRAHFVTASTVLLRREAFDRAGGFDVDPELISVEDYDLWLRMSLLGPFAAVDRTLVRRRWHDTNISADHVRLTRRTLRVLDRFERMPESRPFVEALARRKGVLRYLLGRALLSRGEKAEGRRVLRAARHDDTSMAMRCLALEALSWLPRSALLAIHGARDRRRRAEQA